MQSDIGRMESERGASLSSESDSARGRAHRIVGFMKEERGSATAEYAVATMAAVGFAGLLVVLLRGDEVRALLTELVIRALSTAG
ncbi:MAG: DUF4244 domain-containing protein [Leifsonia sp.]